MRETWMCNPKDHATLWPSWIGEESRCPVWLLGYDASASAWSDVAMALPLEGTSVLDTIISEPALKNVPLLLVGHSLGGLVIKMALANAWNHGVPRHKQFSAQLKGVVFIGTPHFGSGLANLANAFPLLRPNKQVGNMKSNDAYLANLNAQFRDLNLKLGFKVRTFTETQGVTISRRIFGINLLPKIMVVAASSGDPHVSGEVPIPLAGDHFSICKPKNRSAQIHLSLLDFLREVKIDVGSPSIGVSSDNSTNSNEREPNTNHEKVVNDAVEAGHYEPISVFIAVSNYGIESTKTEVTTSAYIVTDEPHVLSRQVALWREQLYRDPLIPIGRRILAKSATLQQLVVEPATRQRLLGWLAITPFSAYVYYGNRSELSELDLTARRKRFLADPLVHRLSKKNERIVCLQSDIEDIDGAVVGAIAEVKRAFNRTVETPKINNRGARNLVEVAKLVAWATSQHLERPEDGDAAAIFESLRTRVRFAQNVVTGTRHLRDQNPLP